METVLGLDLGTNSVGWALVTRHDGEQRPDIIVGVYVFPESAKEEADGTRVSNRSARGQKRRARRQLRRKRQRMRTVLRILIENGLLPADAEERAALMSSDRAGGARPFHPFMLRKKGLDEPLTLYEFGRCIYHIARRRGYMSTRDLIQRYIEERLGLETSREVHLEEPEGEAEAGEGDKVAKERKEESKLLARLAEVRARIEQGNARTIGEFCADILSQAATYPGGVRAGGKRKKGRKTKADPLGWRADRLLYEEEFETLWSVQQRHDPTRLTRALHDRLRYAIFYQRPLMSKRGLIGGCEFFPSRKRLPRAALLAQRCSVLQCLVNLTVAEGEGMPMRRLIADEVQLLADELERKDALSWDEAKSKLGLPPDAYFSDEPVHDRRQRGGRRSARSSADIKGNRTMAVMRRVLGEERWCSFEPQAQEEIVDRLLYAFYPHNVIRGLVRDFGLTVDEVRALAGAELPEGYTNHCRRVWATLEPHMRDGLVYSEACVAAGFRHEGESTVRPPDKIVDKLGALPDLRNPVVQRSAKMAFRVVNAVIDRYGKPDRIRIEMPRDVARSNAERRRLWERQDERYRDRQRAEKLLKDNGLPVGAHGENIRKVLLWEEAGCRCPYEPDVEVSLRQLVDEYTVEHIVPRSRCWDDSWANLTICPFGLNLQKGDRTPYEWLGRTPQWDAIERHVMHLKTMPFAKRQRLLCKEWKEEDFANRALSDTRYLSQLILREVSRLGVPVEVSRGTLTAQLRRHWDLEGCIAVSPEAAKAGEATASDGWQDRPPAKRAKSRDDHRHHALDALVTALTDRSTLQLLSRWYQQREKGLPSANLPRPKPWPEIREDTLALVERMIVVYAPNRGISGALNKDTALKPPSEEVVRTALAQLPPRRNGRPRRAVVIGTQLVRVAPDGKPLAAYDLGSNHHCVIWEKECPEPDGKRRRQMTVVRMIEAAQRAIHGLPVVDKTPPQRGWRYVMALCKDDLVRWTGDRPGLYRVAQFTRGEGFMEIRLRPVTEARASSETHVRVRSADALLLIRERVCMDPLGFVIGVEPSDADSR